MQYTFSADLYLTKVCFIILKLCVEVLNPSTLCVTCNLSCTYFNTNHASSLFHLLLWREPLIKEVIPKVTAKNSVWCRLGASSSRPFGNLGIRISASPLTLQKFDFAFGSLLEVKHPLWSPFEVHLQVVLEVLTAV